MLLKVKKVLIIGVAKSGIAVAHFLRAKGAQVVMTDAKTAEQLQETLKGIDIENMPLVLPGYPSMVGAGFDFVVISPGVPLTVPPVQEAMQMGVPVISELELAYRFCQAPFVAITGTNGKTTTTTLIGEILHKTNSQVFVGGNIGLPLITEVEQLTQSGVVVAEVSSFQLETTVDFKPKVSVILNITPDHLDRHGTLAKYTEAKAKILANQDSTDFTIINYDDPPTRALAEKSRGQVIFFSHLHKLEKGIYVDEDSIIVNLDGQKEKIMAVKDIGIRGAHNLENALAAVAAAWVMGVRSEPLAKVLHEFSGVVHRMEFVAEINGVRFINDSKGTNPDAAMKALDSYNEPVVLIAGGKNKGSDFDQFAQKIKAKTRALVLVGQCAEQIKEQVEKVGYNNIKMAQTFTQAVKMAAAEAQKGEVVLLSPACASWDMFNSYEERGDLFKEVVGQIAQEAKIKG